MGEGVKREKFAFGNLWLKEDHKVLKSVRYLTEAEVQGD